MNVPRSLVEEFLTVMRSMVSENTNETVGEAHPSLAMLTVLGLWMPMKSVESGYDQWLGCAYMYKINVWIRWSTARLSLSTCVWEDTWLCLINLYVCLISMHLRRRTYYAILVYILWTWLGNIITVGNHWSWWSFFFIFIYLHLQGIWLLEIAEAVLYSWTVYF